MGHLVQHIQSKVAAEHSGSRSSGGATIVVGRATAPSAMMLEWWGDRDGGEVGHLELLEQCLALLPSLVLEHLQKWRLVWRGAWWGQRRGWGAGAEGCFLRPCPGVEPQLGPDRVGGGGKASKASVTITLSTHSNWDWTSLPNGPVSRRAPNQIADFLLGIGGGGGSYQGKKPGTLSPIVLIICYFYWFCVTCSGSLGLFWGTLHFSPLSNSWESEQAQWHCSCRRREQCEGHNLKKTS